MTTLNALNNLEGVVTCQCTEGYHRSYICGEPIAHICKACGLALCAYCNRQYGNDDADPLCSECWARDYA